MNAPQASGPQSSRTPSFALPESGPVQRMLGDLLGCAVTVKVASRPLAVDGLSVAVYSTSDGGVAAALGFCDVGFIAASGAALSVLPVPLVAEAVKTGRISETMLENWGEVVNVCASLFNDVSTMHVRLTGRAVVPAKPAPELLAAARASRTRIDFDVTINRYGVGKLALVSLVSS